VSRTRVSIKRSRHRGHWKNWMEDSGKSRTAGCCLRFRRQRTIF